MNAPSWGLVLEAFDDGDDPRPSSTLLSAADIARVMTLMAA